MNYKLSITFKVLIFLGIAACFHFGFVNCSGAGAGDYSAWTTLPTPNPNLPATSSTSSASTAPTMTCNLHFSYNWSSIPATGMPYGYFLDTGTTAIPATAQVLWYSQVNGAVADNGAIYASSGNNMWLSIFTGTVLTDFHQVYVKIVDAQNNTLCTSNTVTYRM